MKNDKWMKWKIALIGTAGMAVLFHTIKSSDEYAVATTNKEVLKVASTSAESSDDPVFNEWLDQESSSSGANADPSTSGRGNHRYVGPDYSEHGGRGWRSSASSNDETPSVTNEPSDTNASEFTTQTGRS
ncbi:hypothetical protein FHS18_002775 [Paenibacillus phyllosphaerae]|uniref:Uncharacterized protein n=1 Tax=Paenibacillus phyllosphaerae TaxID=274593 RepID=A0A7W5AXS8_9BACL|nr:hypothetical protein [Paenibacillus phyllosphaerae]MBB3110708.1 hypothetical protein [Paenibacillus phyllosphaerae]